MELLIWDCCVVRCEGVCAVCCLVLRPQNKMSGPTLKMKSKGGVLKYFGNDRKPLNGARI